MRSLAHFAAMAVLFAGLASAEPPRRYEVSASVWIDGELRGRPSLVVEPGVEGTIEVGRPGGGWRLRVLVEPPAEVEGAAEGALWLTLGLEERVDGEWEFLTDSMLGIPPGRRGSVSVVEEGVQTASPENARLYVDVEVRPAG
ncbi:MAG: hypothetical protein R3323_06080 [Wenzhouxiangellaceae bacterium]|nr:hypothetical protein [Wenzhouxiangellaceae bacterium]